MYMCMYVRTKNYILKLNFFLLCFGFFDGAAKQETTKVYMYVTMYKIIYRAFKCKAYINTQAWSFGIAMTINT